jgi:lipopolysaccharide transport system permease protein
MLRAADPVAPVMIDRTLDKPSIGRTLAGVRRYRHLLRNLVLKDLKLKYRGSVIGFLWSLAHPLLMAIVYTVAFTKILRVGSTGFVFYLMLGLLAWTFFVGSASMSTGAIADSGGLVKSVAFPRAILPIATVLFNLAQYVLSVLVILPLMMAYSGIPVAAPMLLFPVFVALQAIFTIGVALILATATTFFRDVRHLVDVMLGMLFWVTPILYEVSKVPDRLHYLIRLSPMSPYIVAYHQIFYDRQWPDTLTWVLTVSYAVSAAALGLWLIVRYEDGFAERV